MSSTETNLLLTKQCIVRHVIKKLMKYSILKIFVIEGSIDIGLLLLIFDVSLFLNIGLTLEDFNLFGNIPVESVWLINNVSGLIRKAFAFIITTIT